MADEQQDPVPGNQPDIGPGPGPEDGHVLPDEEAYPIRGSALPPVVERWRRRSATGAMLTGFAMGLREVIEPDFREPAIVLETSGVPPKDLAVEADLDNVPPRQSVVKVRRWLLHDPDTTGNPHATGNPDATGDPDATTGADVPAHKDATADVNGGANGGGTANEGGAGPPRPTEIRQRQRRSRSSRIFGGKR